MENDKTELNSIYIAQDRLFPYIFTYYHLLHKYNVGIEIAIIKEANLQDITAIEALQIINNI